MKWISHYDFIEKYIDEFYKEILKETVSFSYQGFSSAHGDKFDSDISEYKFLNTVKMENDTLIFHVFYRDITETEF